MKTKTTRPLKGYPPEDGPSWVDSWGFGNFFFCWLTPEDGDGMEAVFYNFCGPGHVTLMANNNWTELRIQLGGGVNISQLEEIVTWFFLCFFSLAFQTVQYCEGGGIRETRNFLWMSHWVFCREFRATRVFTSANRVVPRTWTTIKKKPGTSPFWESEGIFRGWNFFGRWHPGFFPVELGAFAMGRVRT